MSPREQEKQMDEESKTNLISFQQVDSIKPSSSNLTNIAVSQPNLRIQSWAQIDKRPSMGITGDKSRTNLTQKQSD